MKKKGEIYFIGRFQPFHYGHFNTLKKALELSDKVLIGIYNPKEKKKNYNFFNPFSIEEQVDVINSYLNELEEKERKKVDIFSMIDYIKALYTLIKLGYNKAKIIAKDKKKCIFYSYFGLYPIYIEKKENIRSTEIKRKILEGKEVSGINKFTLKKLKEVLYKGILNKDEDCYNNLRKITKKYF